MNKEQRQILLRVRKVESLLLDRNNLAPSSLTLSWSQRRAGLFLVSGNEAALVFRSEQPLRAQWLKALAGTSFTSSAWWIHSSTSGLSSALWRSWCCWHYLDSSSSSVSISEEPNNETDILLFSPSCFSDASADGSCAGVCISALWCEVHMEALMFCWVSVDLFGWIQSTIAGLNTDSLKPPSWVSLPAVQVQPVLLIHEVFRDFASEFYWDTFKICRCEGKHDRSLQTVGFEGQFFRLQQSAATMNTVNTTCGYLFIGCFFCGSQKTSSTSVLLR